MAFPTRYVSVQMNQLAAAALTICSLQVDFANAYVGGGVLGRGALQEELRYEQCRLIYSFPSLGKFSQNLKKSDLE